ncbi:DNA polymerase I [Capillimicrobium parvum]|uniref:DNA-directed DNA polymerase n=1 Tax=Capillimicrobium parvum TaxID=2884022 RepID=A0A9E7C1G7_9ACTN|nr:DNA polymerase I [Capillimicrobium parvum]UGS37470.1 DNA polymerase I [Capillimicrobium parvum]
MSTDGAASELYLIDGNSLVYRAFFALPESIATSTGFPTNAIFGFASMLVKLITDHGVVPTVVVWDRGSSGRKELYGEYKGHRPTKPDLLGQQYPHMEPLVEAFGYTNYGVDGYEADDVIATIAERAKDAGLAVTIVTGDRDAFQLVDDRVRVMATSRGITETKLYGPEDVEERYGIGPELIPDFYGLKGDTSDNIPGVPGIGDKTAAQLLQRFGTLEEVLDHVDDVSGAKRQENLREHADAARISKQLATAQREVPGVELDITAALAREPDRSRLREVFREFELRDPLRRLEEALGDPDAAAPAPVAETTLPATLREGTLADTVSLKGELTVLVEEAEPPEGELLAAAPWRFAVAGAGGAVVAGGTDSPAAVVAALGDRPVIAHDAKALGAVPANLVHDTLLAAYLLEPARRGYPLRELVEERGLAADLEDPLAARAVEAAALAAWQREQLQDRGLTLLMRDVELPLVPVLRAMEIDGIRLNTHQLAEVADRVHGELRDLEDDIYRLADTEFTIGSPQQLGEVLFVKLGLSKKRRGKTGFSTDARVLQQIRDEHPIVPKIERWRELNQLAKTYLDVLPQMVDEQSRLHTTFVQAAATTGRLASTNPNVQNVPVRTPLGREIRGCFEAAPGNVLVSADYSQVELRVLAHVADEPVLKEIFVRGEDVHTATASQVFEKAPEDLTPMDRSKAKMINYGIVYGLSDYGLADRLNIPREEAKAVIDAYLARFPRVAAFIEGTIEQAKELGYVTTLYGRRRQIPELRARNYQVRTLGERLAVNTVIQGTAADVIKLAMIGAARSLSGSHPPLRSRLILTIHDELLFEGPPEEEAAVRELIEREMLAPWEDRDPPLEVDVGAGRTWLEAK